MYILKTQKQARKIQACLQSPETINDYLIFKEQNFRIPILIDRQKESQAYNFFFFKIISKTRKSCHLIEKSLKIQAFFLKQSKKQSVKFFHALSHTDF